MDDREAFPLELGRVTRRWRARLDVLFRDTGLTQARWMALVLLARAGQGITQRELAELANIEGPTLVRILDGLERKGMVERRSGDGDRRVKRLYLTPSAQPVLDQIDRISTDLRRELLADVDPDELAICLRILRRIGDRLESR